MQLSSIESLKAVFRKLDPLVVKKNELLDAKLSLLGYQNSLEYNQAMVGYIEGKIKRLVSDIQNDEDERHKIEMAKRATDSGKIPTYIQLAKAAS